MNAEDAYSQARQLLRDRAKQADEQGHAAAAVCFDVCADLLWENGNKLGARMAAWRRQQRKDSARKVSP